jgi:hypothetical protein
MSQNHHKCVIDQRLRLQSWKKINILYKACGPTPYIARKILNINVIEGKLYQQP